eukprot:sb/3479500/
MFNRCFRTDYIRGVRETAAAEECNMGLEPRVLYHPNPKVSVIPKKLRDAESAAGSGGGLPMDDPDLADAGHLPGFTPSIQSEGYDYSLHYFRGDPEKRIDFVLVYREVIEDIESCGENTPIQRTGKELEAKKRRRIFEENLERKGLEIERETYDKNDGPDVKRVVYVKINASRRCLFEYAEHLQIKKLLKIDPMKIFRDEYKEDRTWSEWKIFSGLHSGEKFYKDEVWDELRNHRISARFEERKADRFINHDEPGFFTTSERSLIVSYILQETPFEEDGARGPGASKGEVGIEHLLKDDVYLSWYPLHDGPFQLPSIEDKPPEEKVFLNDRQVLGLFWANWGRWAKYQPLNRVRIYFGDTIAMYFAWLAAFFLEFWKRYQITLAFLWSKADLRVNQEPARPEYAVTCEEDDVRYNPITLRWEPYREQSVFKTITAISVVIITVVVVIITLISIIIYKIAVYSVFDTMADGQWKPYASTLASVSGSILQLVAITILSFVYAWLAEKITLWENFRTETEYQNNVTVKRFIFEFFNYHGSCFYIAFIKGNFAGYPGHYTRLFGIRLDTCGPGGCLGELAQNLAIIFLGKQILNNVQELLCPSIKSGLSRRNSKKYTVSLWYTILDYKASIAIVTNAFVIAFVCDCVSQVLWKYNHEDTLAQYVSGHLSNYTGPALDGSEGTETCMYWDYRDNEGEATIWWWKLKAVQFIFVVVFEHFVFTVVRCIDLLIPDVPEKLEALIHLEDSFAREMMKEVIEVDLEQLEDMRHRIEVKRKQRNKYI